MKFPQSVIIHEGAVVADGARLGDYVVVYPGAYIADETSVAGFTQIWSGVRLEQGAMLGPGVVIDEPIDKGVSDVIIGAHSKVGAGATICRGVAIGEGALVESGSVVTHNVPPYAKVSGVPARIIGYVENLRKETQELWNRHAEFPSAPESVPLGIGGVTLHRLKFVGDLRGDLSVGEFSKDIPFMPRRYFLVFNVPSEKTRGEHAHRQCHQFLICVKGSCAVVVDDGKSRAEVQLDSPEKGIYLPPLTWGVQYKYSSDAVLLAFTSDYYDADDYIRNYAEFIDIVQAKAAE